MATDAREARRRKIVDRGADRLALITGRIQTLPSSSHDENTTTLGPDPLYQPLISNGQDLQPHVSDQTTGTPSLFLSESIWLFSPKIVMEEYFKSSKFSKSGVEF